MWYYILVEKYLFSKIFVPFILIDLIYSEVVLCPIHFSRALVHRGLSLWSIAYWAFSFLFSFYWDKTLTVKWVTIFFFISDYFRVDTSSLLRTFLETISTKLFAFIVHVADRHVFFIIKVFSKMSSLSKNMFVLTCDHDIVLQWFKNYKWFDTLAINRVFILSPWAWVGLWGCLNE